MHRIRQVLGGLVLAALATAVVYSLVSDDGREEVVAPDGDVEDAVGWLIGRQEPDGGFELADSVGFETPDAVLAIAAHGQTTAEWSPTEARAAVAAADVGGVTALDWLVAFSRDALPGQGGFSPEQAAKVVVLAALPLGDDPAAYDPAGDGDPVDLTAGLDAISPDLYNSFLFARMAEALMGADVDQDDLQEVCEAQAPDGGWSFDGDPGDANPSDLDSTGYSALTLDLAGVAPADAVLTAAAGYFEATQIPGDDPDHPADAGAWRSLGQPDPNATSLAVLGLESATSDPGALPYDPDAWLRAQQVTSGPADDLGRIESPSDEFGVNTFATAQTVQALLRANLPLHTEAAGRECVPAVDQ